MRGRSNRLPVAARGLLKLLPGRASYERARGDLEDVYGRIESTRGRRAAGRACVHHALSIVLWAMIEGVRGWFGSRGGPGGADRRDRIMGWGFLQDLRIGVRSLARRPGFSVLAIGILAVGIGADTAIFTLADRLFFEKPAAVRDADRLVRVFRSWAPGMGGAVSYPDYEEYRDGSVTLGGLAAYATAALPVTARWGGGSSPAGALMVTANYFEVLGVVPALGRFFMAEENRTPDTHPVAVVSWGFWRDRLGGAADIVGRNVLLNGYRFTVVGVAPRGFRGVSPGSPVPEMYVPVMMLNVLSPRSDTAWRERIPDFRDRWLNVVGRLEPDATVASAQAELAVIAERIRALDGTADSNESVLVTGDFRWFPSTRTYLSRLMRILLITVGLLLAIATANVAILLAARASTRDREVGIRAALGAGRGRVARQLLAESGILGVAGGAAGIAVSFGAARVASTLLPVRLDPPPAPDGGVLLLALGLSLATAFIAGLFPALRASRRDVVGMIQGRDRHAGGGRLRDALVVFQIGLSLVLVAGSALFARSLAAARGVNIGFEDRGILLTGVDLRNHGYDDVRGRAFVQEALDRLRALPGVTLATTTRQVPFRGDWTTDMEPWLDETFPGGQSVLTVGLNVVSPGYFETMMIPVLLGRGFDRSDTEGSPPVIVVNETFARMAFPDGQALGRRVPLRPDEPEFVIVGVVRDARYYALDEEPWPQLYAAFMQAYRPGVNFLVRTTEDPATLARGVRDALHAIDPDVAIASSETLESVHAEQIARFRASALVVGMAGLIALLLASAGLYGVMAYRVAQETREIGVRMALGATSGVVAGSILRRGLRLAGLGVAVGVVGALALGGLVQGLLFGVPARDPVSLVVAPMLLLGVASAASLLPARRAMRVDPMRAMRAD